MIHYLNGIQIAWEVFTSVQSIVKKVPASWNLSTFVFLQTSVKLMIIQSSKNSEQKNHAHVNKSKTGYRHNMNTTIVWQWLFLFHRMYPICVEGKERELRSIWSSVDCVRNEIVNAEADPSSTGEEEEKNTNTLACPNVKISIFCKCWCSVYAKTAL